MPSQIDMLLRTFRRQMRITRVLRFALLIGTAIVLFWAINMPGPYRKQVMFGVFIATLIVWVLSMINTARLARSLRTASALVGVGQLDNAEIWLRRTLEKLSLSTRTKVLAFQQMASLLFRRDAHADVVAVCGALLEQRISSLKPVWINTRLMMADSLLMLDRACDAYDAIRPVYDVPLSLSDRMKLLPIQLRYELAADHAEAATQGMPEKLQIAELMDSPRAALVHALLAEACRRSNMAEQQAYLTERAWLYHDLDQLAERYPIIAPVASRPAGGPSA